MKLIAFMVTPGGLTGAPKRLLTLADALRKSGVDVCVASQPDSELLEVAEAQGHVTSRLTTSGVLALQHGALFGGGVTFKLRVLLALLSQQWRVLRCIQCNRAGVVWIRGSKGIAFAAVGTLLSRRPLIWDVDYELPSRGAVRWLHRFGLWAAQTVVFQYRGAADVIFGPQLADKYRRKFKSVLPGIDFAPLGAVVSSGSSRISDPDERIFTIVQVGTICERKNQRLIIDALGELVEQVSEQRVRLLLVGGIFQKNYAVSLYAAIERLGLEGIVEFLGWRDDVHSVVASSDLMVMPSLNEGVPNALQEAMYLGVPAIVSRVGGMPEIVEHDQTGWVLPLGEPATWAEQIGACVETQGLCREVGKRASEYARTRFSTDTWGWQYAEVVRAAAKYR